MSYELRWEAKGFVKRYFGYVVPRELTGPVGETECNEKFDALKFVINDCLDMQGVSFEQAEIEDIAALDAGASAANARIKMAIVTVDPRVVDLAQRYMEAATEAYPTAVFAPAGRSAIARVDSIQRAVKFVRDRAPRVPFKRCANGRQPDPSTGRPLPGVDFSAADVGIGSTSDSRVSDLTAGKLIFQLSDWRADVRGRH